MTTLHMRASLPTTCMPNLAIVVQDVVATSMSSLRVQERISKKSMASIGSTLVLGKVSAPITLKDLRY